MWTNISLAQSQYVTLSASMVNASYPMSAAATLDGKIITLFFSSFSQLDICVGTVWTVELALLCQAVSMEAVLTLILWNQSLSRALVRRAGKGPSVTCVSEFTFRINI